MLVCNRQIRYQDNLNFEQIQSCHSPSLKCPRSLAVHFFEPLHVNYLCTQEYSVQKPSQHLTKKGLN